ncbi:Hypothetical predicted protein [Pelobates cultripes]|uniref:Uncharacterized protein n=1 Tax=Pelobates cultripes TaxID=61616 RepID=A0AAD1RQN2_PELCU|nr:Hypothetical predicted protein [Pelobates cultripes]
MTAMHGERPRHIAAADIKHIASRASKRGRARPTYGRAQNRPRPQHATRSRKEAQPPSGRYRTDETPGWRLTPGSVCGAGPPPPLGRRGLSWPCSGDPRHDGGSHMECALAAYTDKGCGRISKPAEDNTEGKRKHR